MHAANFSSTTPQAIYIASLELSAIPVDVRVNEAGITSKDLAPHFLPISESDHRALIATGFDLFRLPDGRLVTYGDDTEGSALMPIATPNSLAYDEIQR